MVWVDRGRGVGIDMSKPDVRIVYGGKRVVVGGYV